MDEKIRSEIQALTANNHYRQYPASKAQLARLSDLGLTGLMPDRFLGGGRYGIGYADAEAVLRAAEDAGGTTGGWTPDGDGDVVRSGASALYRLLHAEPEDDAPDLDDDPDDDPEEDYEADPADEALDRLIDEVAEIEQRRFEMEQAAIVEEQMRREAELDELRPLSEFAHLAKPATLRRAAWQGRLVAEKIGRDWFTSEREVRRFLDNRRKQHNTGVRLNAHVSVREAAGRLIVTIEELLWTGYESADAVNEMPLFPLAHDRLVHNREYEREYEFPVVTDNRVKVVGVARAYECQGWRTRYTYYFAVMHDATVIVVHDDGKREYYSA